VFIFSITSLVFSGFYYVQSFKHGLDAKKWAVAGIAFGPIILPLFNMQKRLSLRKARGAYCTIFQA
jgi:hypothetical protein